MKKNTRPTFNLQFAAALATGTINNVTEKLVQMNLYTLSFQSTISAGAI